MDQRWLSTKTLGLAVLLTAMMVAGARAQDQALVAEGGADGIYAVNVAIDPPAFTFGVATGALAPSEMYVRHLTAGEAWSPDPAGSVIHHLTPLPLDSAADLDPAPLGAILSTGAPTGFAYAGSTIIVCSPAGPADVKSFDLSTGALLFTVAASAGYTPFNCIVALTPTSVFVNDRAAPTGNDAFLLGTPPAAMTGTTFTATGGDPVDIELSGGGGVAWISNWGGGGLYYGIGMNTSIFRLTLGLPPAMGTSLTVPLTTGIGPWGLCIVPPPLGQVWTFNNNGVIEIITNDETGPAPASLESGLVTGALSATPLGTPKPLWDGAPTNGLDRVIFTSHNDFPSPTGAFGPGPTAEDSACCRIFTTPGAAKYTTVSTTFTFAPTFDANVFPRGVSISPPSAVIGGVGGGRKSGGHICFVSGVDQLNPLRLVAVGVLLIGMMGAFWAGKRMQSVGLLGNR